MAKHYWFYLPQSVYVAVRDNVLLYDTVGNRHLVISESFMKPVFRRLLDIENMGAVMISAETADSGVVRRITGNGMGMVIDTAQQVERPAVLPLHQSVNLDYDRIKDEELTRFFLNKDLARYLLEFSIVNDVSADSRCARFFIPDEAYRTGRTFPGISMSTVRSVMDQIRYCPLTRIKVITDCMDTADGSAAVRSVVSQILRTGKKPVVCMNLESGLVDDIAGIPDVGLEFTVDSFRDMERLRERFLRTHAENSHVRFIVRSEGDYMSALELIAEFGSKDYELYPCPDESNRDFVSRLLSPEREEVFARPVSMKEIFRNSKLNSNTFGQLTVVPGGDIHADSFSPPVGNAGKDRILDCIRKAVSSKDTWRRTRQYPKCAGCLLQYLCPPPSPFDEKLDLSSGCASFMR